MSTVIVANVPMNATTKDFVQAFAFGSFVSCAFIQNGDTQKCLLIYELAEDAQKAADLFGRKIEILGTAIELDASCKFKPTKIDEKLEEKGEHLVILYNVHNKVTEDMINSTFQTKSCDLRSVPQKNCKKCHLHFATSAQAYDVCKIAANQVFFGMKLSPKYVAPKTDTITVNLKEMATNAVPLNDDFAVDFFSKNLEVFQTEVSNTTMNIDERNIIISGVQQEVDMLSKKINDLISELGPGVIPVSESDAGKVVQACCTKDPQEKFTTVCKYVPNNHCVFLYGLKSAVSRLSKLFVADPDVEKPKPSAKKPKPVNSESIPISVLQEQYLRKKIVPQLVNRKVQYRFSGKGQKRLFAEKAVLDSTNSFLSQLNVKDYKNLSFNNFVAMVQYLLEKKVDCAYVPALNTATGHICLSVISTDSVMSSVKAELDQLEKATLTAAEMDEESDEDEMDDTVQDFLDKIDKISDTSSVVSESDDAQLHSNIVMQSKTKWYSHIAYQELVNMASQIRLHTKAMFSSLVSITFSLKDEKTNKSEAIFKAPSHVDLLEKMFTTMFFDHKRQIQLKNKEYSAVTKDNIWKQIESVVQKFDVKLFKNNKLHCLIFRSRVKAWSEAAKKATLEKINEVIDVSMPYPCVSLAELNYLKTLLKNPVFVKDHSISTKLQFNFDKPKEEKSKKKQQKSDYVFFICGKKKDAEIAASIISKITPVIKPVVLKYEKRTSSFLLHYIKTKVLSKAEEANVYIRLPKKDDIVKESKFVVQLACENEETFEQWSKYLIELAQVTSSEVLQVNAKTKKITEDNVSTMEKDFSVMTKYNEEKTLLFINGFYDSPSNAKEWMQSKLQNQQSNFHHYKVPSVVFPILLSTCKKQLESILSAQKCHSALKYNEDNKITIKGKNVDIQTAVCEINKLVQDIQASLVTETIKLNPSEYWLLKNRSKPKVASIERDTGVSVSFNVDQTYIAQTMKYGNRNISLHFGNIAYSKAEIVVNAANGDMNHAAGIAKAIIDKAGAKVQQQCNELVKSCGKIPEGEAVITGAGNMKHQQHIIHAVGPYYNNGMNQEQQKLENCVMKALILASAHKCKSISIPAISSGIFNYPLNECLTIVSNAVKKFFDANPSSSLSEIQFYTNDPEMCKLWIVKMKDAFLHTSINSTVAQHTKWYWKDDENNWRPYKDSENNAIQAAYLSGDSCFEITINNINYVIQFKAKPIVQVNKATNFKHEVSNTRPMENRAKWFWIDDNQNEQPYSEKQSEEIELAYKSNKAYALFTFKRFLDDLDAEYCLTFQQPKICNVTKKTYIASQTKVSSNYTRGVIRKEAIVPAPLVLPQLELTEEITEDASVKQITVTGVSTKVTEACYKLKQLISGFMQKKVIPHSVSDEVIQQIKAEYKDAKITATPHNVTVEYYYDKLQGICDKLLLSAIKQTATITTYPPTWQPQTTSCELFIVPSTSPEYHTIVAEMQKTLSSVQVLKIERIQNKHLWKQYNESLQFLKEKNGGFCTQAKLFHGTRSTPPEKIYKGEMGFAMQFCNSGMWGLGTYFAVNASYSNGYAHPLPDGSKQFFYADVLLGAGIKLASDSNLRLPPIKNISNAKFTDERYDSVEGLTGGSVVHIVYENKRAYPSYLITFK